ncbi:hypothetical protein GGI12_003838 [Dipsacomyces acuminosporus]|nr:hypothetical protein GGI12_003838 [Dipsacomyces acuminosporus]
MEQDTARALFEQVRKWSKQDERLLPNNSVSRQDVDRIKINIRQLDPGLGAYPLTKDMDSSYRRWLQLTSHVTKEVLARILPSDGGFTSATGSAYEDEEMQNARKMLERTKESGGFDALLTGRNDPKGKHVDRNAVIDREIETLTSIASSTDDRFAFPYVDIRHSFPKDAQPSMIYQYTKDKSWLLRNMLRTQWQNDFGTLLGEFQLSFLIIFVGQNFTGFEHWKRLLQLVLSSAQALEDPDMLAGLIIPFVRLLMVQLKECPQEFVATVLEQDNFIARILSAFVLNVFEMEDLRLRDELHAEIEQLRAFLDQAFGWKLPSGKQLQEEADLEEGEYAPQIVDL